MFFSCCKCYEFRLVAQRYIDSKCLCMCMCVFNKGVNFRKFVLKFFLINDDIVYIQYLTEKSAFQKSIWKKVCKIEDISSVLVVLCVLFVLGFCQWSPSE